MKDKQEKSTEAMTKEIASLENLVSLEQFNRAKLNLNEFLKDNPQKIQTIQEMLGLCLSEDRDKVAFFIGEYMLDKRYLSAANANDMGKFVGQRVGKHQGEVYFTECLRLEPEHPFASLNNAALSNDYLVFDAELIAQKNKLLPKEMVFPFNPYPKREPEIERAKEMVRKTLRAIRADDLQKELFLREDDESEIEPVPNQKEFELDSIDLDSRQHRDQLVAFLLSNYAVLSQEQQKDLHFFLWEEIHEAFLQKRSADSLKLLDLLQQNDQKTPYPRLLRAVSLLKTKRPAVASSEFKQLVALFPNNFFCQLAFGLFYSDKKEATKAQVAATAFLVQWDGATQLDERMDLIFSNEKKLDLIVLSKAASDLAQETEDPGLLGVLSDWLITKQQWKPAVELCEELNQLDPLDLTHKTRTETLHLTLLEAGNKQEAKRLFHKAIEFFKLSNRAQENIAAYKKMVTCYALLGESAQQKGAESQLRQLKFKIEQDTREQNIANLMQEAQLLLNRNEYHGAIRLLKEAFSHNKSSENYRALAAVYKKLHWSRALKDLNDQWQDLQTNSERKTKS